MREKSPRTPERIISRMATPSWIILGTLNNSHPKPLSKIEMKKVAEELYASAKYTVRRMDETTLFHAIERMQRDGLVAEIVVGDVDVRVSRDKTMSQSRQLYGITDLGMRMMAHQTELLKGLLGLISKSEVC